MILFAAKNLENKKKIVNDLNVFPVPDGDTGTNMALTIQFAAKEVSKLQSNDLSRLPMQLQADHLWGLGKFWCNTIPVKGGFARHAKIKTSRYKGSKYPLQSGAEMAYKAVMKPTEHNANRHQGRRKVRFNNYTKHETLSVWRGNSSVILL